ncbi:COPII coat assembly protein-like protein [Hapsidospora chrysogenum ATCC 11550]|uniref:Protein transport protein sec16 n=1 Tax=Hapsidospora chrysogenum (strain ATCC 11550 / CBS 779.69 / DSM 880 / IAM 14645 / JCM 23072 / IMI 49137) TaxID=857340 RepID=A0A086TC78_HAPC1|nr:COPII coat assembly protein-like protein [Hapsidospora chrysogenum ATCC 11550]
MAEEAPNSSWHPALMPNHKSPPPATAEPTRRPSPDASPDSLHNGTPLESEPEPHSLDFTSNDKQDEDAADAWFADGAADSGPTDWLTKDDADEGGAMLASRPGTATTQPAAQTPQEAGKEPASKPVSQHASSMSFARTVSHEPSLGDDEPSFGDEAEDDWSLSRTDTDPFKFMPPNDRTNSFPAVPPMTSETDDHDNQPLPSNQALDVLQETEQDWDIHDQSDNTQHAQGFSPHPDTQEAQSSHCQHATSRSMGGNYQAHDEQTAETRYEEGVPLISNFEATAQRARGSEQTGKKDPFADDDANDDFFAQVNGSESEERKPTLERKSTSHFLGGLDSEPPTRQGTFGTVNEEDETPEAESNKACTSQQRSTHIGHRRTKTQDLKAKWAEAFEDDDDDDFLLEDSATENKEPDPAGFLGSDDEGLLEEGDDDAPATAAPQTSQQAWSQQSASSPYAPPQNAYQPGSPVYQPTQQPSPQVSQDSFYNPPAPTDTFGTALQYGRPPPAPVAGVNQPKAQSFVDKKGGYSSPFDLPTDLLGSVPKPRKRPSTQSLHTPAPASQPVPPASAARSTSAGTSGPPPSNSRPPSSHGSQAPPPISHKSSAPSLRNKGSFFEELPVVPKARPASRHSNRVPSPGQPLSSSPLKPSPLGPSTTSQVSPASAPPPNQMQHSPPATAAGNLVAPERVSPYAALQSGPSSVPPPSTTASRYSPAPGQSSTNSAPPPAAGNRYSPAPPAPRQSSYSPSRASTTTPPILPHQPRTSSPLAHFETSNGKPYGEIALAERRSSGSSYEPRLNRVPSLPPTREVDEEDDPTGAGVSLGTRHSSMESRYSPNASASRQTPPPPAYAGQATLSPPKRTGSNYAPQVAPASQPGFVPPPRAQTQSPGATRSSKPATYGHVRRPSSAHGAAVPEMAKPAQSSYAPQTRSRGQSLNMNMAPPTDGREHDPLERWKGVPIFTWGVGGTLVTSFPQSIPRYTIASSTPTITRAPGEVKMRNIKEIDPLPERLAKFPGPLKGKSKKKETVNWLANGIETLEKDLPDVSFHSELSLEAKRGIERLLLWKILRLFIEHDGILEGTPAVEQAVREILSPDSSGATSETPFSAGLPTGALGAPSTTLQPDSVDSETMESIRISLMKGERENAVWAAVDKRLWGHAMLIANTVSPDLYKQVAQEFVRKEVNYPGHSNEPIAALYKVLSGSYEDCVDELVPSHARAGFQLVSTDATTRPSKGAIDGLDRWRETLTLILSNRSPEDVRGLKALGDLLAGYGRAEAAHICYMFSRSVSIFGGIDDLNASLVLLGSDHKQQASHFAKETEPLQLSEVYEFGLSLAGGVNAASGAPHLAAYKLQHALTLAEYGYRDKALQYCEAIATAMSSQTKRSPYYNAYLAASVDNFMVRLKQAPKGESGSWISKPSMNKVSDSMWNKFNKFVSGDDEDGNGANGAKNGDNSPFNHINTTPNISRSPSVNNFEMYGGGAPGYPGVAAPPASAPSSKYAPVAAQPSAQPNSYEPASLYTPRTSIDAGSSGYPGYPVGAPEVSYPGSAGPTQNGPHGGIPTFQSPEAGATTDASSSAGYRPQGLQQSASMPVLSSVQGQESSNQGYSPPSYGYEPPGLNTVTLDNESNQPAEEQGSSGYEPPSYQPQGYEPPSYEPDPEPSTEDGDASRRKKGMMDDDDDDIPALRAQEKSRAEKDRENEEMFRKVAEEDAKRAAEEKSAKKGWGFGSWFGKRPESPKPGDTAPKAIKANLGEASSFVYDPELKRWVNKKPGAENAEPKAAAPPPPRATRSVSGTPPPPTGTPPPMRSSSQGPPPRSIPPSGSAPQLRKPAPQDVMGAPEAPFMSRSVSNNSAAGGPPSAPSSRPGTSMSNASSIDDLLGAPGPRKGAKKPRKSGRYVDVMAK